MALAASLSSGWCVSSNESYMADGRKGHVINCTPGWTGGIVGAVANASTSWGTCFEKAGELCGAKGYTVLHRSDEPGFAAHVGQYGGHASTTNNRTLIVRCNEGGSQQAKK
jgi:hypothetical protein